MVWHIILQWMQLTVEQEQEQESNWFFQGRIRRKVMKEFVGLRAKAYAYLMGDDSEKKSYRNKKMCNKKNT